MKNLQLPSRFLRASNASRLLGSAVNGVVVVGFHAAYSPDPIREMMETGTFHSPLVGFNYILRGTGSFTGRDGQIRPLHPGVFFHLDVRNTYRLIHHGDDFMECWVVLHQDLYELMLKMGFIPTNRVWQDIGLHLSLVEAYEALKNDVQDAQIQDSVLFRRILSLLEQIYAVDSAYSKQDDLMRRAQCMLDNDLQKNLPTDTVANRLGLSATHLRRLFHATMGISPKEYRLKKRIEKACQLLRTKPPKSVASELGYENMYYFSKQFKLYTGQSPRAYCQQQSYWSR